MANETVLFKRGDSATITSTPVTDGQILFDTSGNGKMYLDNGTDRLEMGGAITVDASLSKTSTNAIQNKAVTGNILNSLAEVSAATQQNTIAGALALKEVNSSLDSVLDSFDELKNRLSNNLIIPTMTANNTPYNTVTASSFTSGNEAYKAFDNDFSGSNYWQPSTVANSWIQYTFDEIHEVKKITIHSNSNMPKTYTLSIIDENNVEKTICNGTSSDFVDNVASISLGALTKCKAIKLSIASAVTGYIHIYEIQAIGL